MASLWSALRCGKKVRVVPSVTNLPYTNHMRRRGHGTKIFRLDGQSCCHLAWSVLLAPPSTRPHGTPGLDARTNVGQLSFQG
jgi:hypothetical protein